MLCIPGVGLSLESFQQCLFTLDLEVWAFTILIIESLKKERYRFCVTVKFVIHNIHPSCVRFTEIHVITSGICYWSKCYLQNSTFPVCFVPDSEITCISVYTAFWIWYKANCKCRICWVTFAPIAYPWGNQFLSEVELVHCETEESTVFQLYLAICKRELFFCVGKQSTW